MARATVYFEVPAEAEPLVGAVEEFGGEFEDMPAGDDPVVWLPAFGGFTSAVFEEVDDPIEAAEAVLRVLRAAGGRYMAVTDAFEERSRGMRALGRVYLNLSGGVEGERRLSFPWEAGDPGIDRRTLVEAGLSEREVGEAMEAFFPATSAPGPRT